MPRFPGFVGGSNTPQSLIADAERTMNLYVEPTQSGNAKAPSALYPTPGFRLWSSVSDIGSRGFVNAGGRFFAVIGSGFYEFSSTGGATKWGTVGLDANLAQLVYNGKVGGQVGICSGGLINSFVLGTNTFAGPHFGGASITMLAYADGYGLGFDATSGRVYLSALNDFTTWTLGTFFQRSKFPDPWQAMFVDTNSLIWMVGSETFEVWYDTGAGTQPWAPLSGLFGRYGIAAPFAYGVSGAGLFWLSRSQEGGASVVTTRGSVPQAVSTYAVSAALKGYQRSSRISDAEMLIYHDEGHTFANLSFPSAGATWSYDAENRGWAERGKWNSGSGAYDIWAPRVHVDVFGKHLVGDRTTGTIWEMDTAIATEVDGSGIRRQRRTPGVTAEHQRVAINSLELLMDVGLGLQGTGQGSDPQVMLRVSADGGRTFGNERRAGMGRIGEYGKRVYWNRLGEPEDLVLDVSWSDPVPIRVMDAFVNNNGRVG